MGASGWSYFVPYEPDISAALERLRQAVFQRGDYYWRGSGYEFWDEADNRLAMGEDPAVVEIERMAKRDSMQKPSSIAELFEWNEEVGTHSIIDMDRGVSTDPAFGTVSSLTDDQLISGFGTTTPTHAQIEQWEAGGDPIGSVRSRWKGLYIVVYKGDVPTELYFAGFSGD